MSRATVGWLRVAVFTERIRGRDDSDVTTVLPEPPKNGQYPPWVYVLCSFLVVLDYMFVSAGVLVLAFVLSVNDVPLPNGRVGGLLTLVGLAAVVYGSDAVVSQWRGSPLDELVRRALRPVRGPIRRRLVRFDQVSHRDLSPTARPTMVAGFAGWTPPDTTAGESVGTRWGSRKSFPPEDHDETGLSLSEGQRFGAFELDAEVGRGALSVVWRAEDLDTGQTVALKIFDPLVDENTRRTYEADFLHEARVLRRLRDHEHVITLYDSGYDPSPWIAVEYVESGTLRDHLPVSLPVALTVVTAMTEAIEYAHGQDISHTDLKPENVLYSEKYFGRLILVTDWGKRPVVNPDLEPMVSFPYAAPEQFDDYPTNESDAERIDIYQLGLVAYELFTGTHPFLDARNEDVLEQQIRNEVPRPPSDHVSDLPDAFDRVILTAIAKHPDDRFQTVAAFRTALLDALLPDVKPRD